MSRRPNPLALFVASGRFDASNWRHRKLLEAEDLPEEADPELRGLQCVYRRRKMYATAAYEARAFESVAHEAAEARR